MSADRPVARGDFETASPVELKTAGVHVYAADPRTLVWCFAWAIGNEPVQLWTPDEPGDIERLFDHIRNGALFGAWNAAFERQIWAQVMVPRYGWPPLPLEQVRCTMARALAMALPGALDKCGAAVGLELQKDAEGKAVMLKLAKPVRQDVDGSHRYGDTPELLKRLGAYCVIDVEVERLLDTKLLPLSDDEERMWQLDQRINDRGVQLDVPALAAALEVVDDAQARVAAKLGAVTRGEVSAVTKVAALTTWLEGQGVEVDGMAKADVIDLLTREDLPADAREALLLRQEAAKASTAKLKAMRASIGVDGRARGLFQFNGASTGRWAGRRIQLQNLPRPRKKPGQEAIDAMLDMLAGAGRELAPPSKPVRATRVSVPSIPLVPDRAGMLALAEALEAFT